MCASKVTRGVVSFVDLTTLVSKTLKVDLKVKARSLRTPTRRTTGTSTRSSGVPSFKDPNNCSAL